LIAIASGSRQTELVLRPRAPVTARRAFASLPPVAIVRLAADNPAARERALGERIARVVTATALAGVASQR
jgi:hypothetical protein